MIKQDLFNEIIESLKNQYDKDTDRASVLSEVYGNDIDPVDNSLLTKAVFKLLGINFSLEQLSEISFFCYDQNFGRSVNKTIEDLWQKLINTIDVVDETTVK